MTARKDPSLKCDPVRKALAEQLRRNDLSMKHASTAIGRNPAYLHQYLTRGFPTVLGFRDSEKLAELLGCSAEALRHKTVPARKPAKRKPRASPPPGAPNCPIPEVAVEAATGALDEELARETARWYLPEAMLRHEGGANPDNLKILKVRGNSMEPEMREGDRVVVDTARRQPAMGELIVLSDGTGVVVKRVETVREAAPVRLRLFSANPDYAPYTCLAEEARIIGKVLWTIKRV